MLAQYYEEFIESLQISNLEEELIRVKEITKRLNKSFWEIDNEEEKHSYVVGSLGRVTAIKTFSDIDMLFILPRDLKTKYSNCEGNGQSQLLQAVKKEIKKRYPNTIVRGDGQVVVVSFESINKTVEVCPVFERSDGAYDYPDSNNGGAWKKTDPMPELRESLSLIEETNRQFSYICNLIRAWKNHEGFKFGGLLIDTLVYNFLDVNKKYKNVTFDNYLSLLKDLFLYLKNRNKEQKYWYALGSNQKVYNKKGTFVTKSEKVYKKIKDLTEDSENIYDTMQEIFGTSFPIPEDETVTASITKSYFAQHSIRQTEEYIEKKFEIDIRYSLKVDCLVKQNGFRDKFLRTILRERSPLKINKRLEFFVAENEFENLSEDFNTNEKFHYEVYWKVLNRGEEAIRRDCIRGQITRDTGRQRKIETSDFKGEHVVECYIIYKNICVAKDRLKVPISI